MRGLLQLLGIGAGVVAFAVFSFRWARRHGHGPHCDGERAREQQMGQRRAQGRVR